MPDYKITWEIDLSAADPKAAARQALKIQRDANSSATIFDVFDQHGEQYRVDIQEAEAPMTNPNTLALPTPTPWAAKNNKSGISIIGGGRTIAVVAFPEYHHVPSKSNLVELQRANTALIVEAVNGKAALEAENFALAAHQCDLPDGDEFGNALCGYKAENKALKSQVEELAEALDLCVGTLSINGFKGAGVDKGKAALAKVRR